MIPNDILEAMVRTLKQNPDGCLILNDVFRDKRHKFRFMRDGTPWTLNRYLYWRLTGDRLPSTIRLFRSCRTYGCQNPLHHRQRYFPPAERFFG